MRVWWAAVVLAAVIFNQLASAQSFDTLYASSPQPRLAEPLQWLAVPKTDTIQSSQDQARWLQLFSDSQNGWVFKDSTPRMPLPTGLTHDVWMRFALAPTTELQTWFLRIPKINPVRVTLFNRDAQGVWQAQSAGNLVAPAQWPLRTRTPTFELKTSTTEPRAFFIRFENQSAIAERPQVLSTVEYISGAYGVGAMLGLLVGASSLLTTLCLIAFSLSRKTVFLWLSAAVMVMLFNQLTLSGFASWQIWPQSQQLHQNMGWATSFLALGSGAWLMARASYAQDTHRWIYRLLGAVALLALMLAAATAFDVHVIPGSAKNVLAAAMVLLVVSAVGWLTLRGHRFNAYLLLGLAPIGLAALNRVAYNAGGLAHIEFAQLMGMIASMLGLLVFFSALVWRSRDALLLNRRAQALADYDAETGLLTFEKAKTRLPRLLLRGNRPNAGGGVILLRWVDASSHAGLVASSQRSQILRQIGDLMRMVGRDIDSLIRHDDDHFLMLIEGPISRDALSGMASQIMAASLRGAEPSKSGGEAPATNLHIAIWQETTGTTTANNVMALLMRRLNLMGKGTTRRVQFIDSAVSDHKGDSTNEQRRRKRDMLNKINAIESEPRQSITFTDASPDKPK